MSQEVTARHSDHSPVRWNAVMVGTGLILLCLVVLFPPYHLTSAVKDTRVYYDCTASVYRFAPMPEELLSADPVYDAAGFWRRVLSIVIATGMALLRREDPRREPSPFAAVRPVSGAAFLLMMVLYLLVMLPSALNHPGYVMWYPDND